MALLVTSGRILMLMFRFLAQKGFVDMILALLFMAAHNQRTGGGAVKMRGPFLGSPGGKKRMAIFVTSFWKSASMRKRR